MNLHPALLEHLSEQERAAAFARGFVMPDHTWSDAAGCRFTEDIPPDAATLRHYGIIPFSKAISFVVPEMPWALPITDDPSRFHLMERFYSVVTLHAEGAAPWTGLVWNSTDADMLWNEPGLLWA